jgi:hypothetical protein
MIGVNFHILSHLLESPTHTASWERLSQDGKVKLPALNGNFATLVSRSWCAGRAGPHSLCLRLLVALRDLATLLALPRVALVMYPLRHFLCQMPKGRV